MLPLVRPRTMLVTLVILGSVGFGCFFREFFPVKPLVPGYTDVANYSHSDPPTTRSLSIESDAPFSRLVFMVVDALRSDFVHGPDSSMDFVRSLVTAGRAIPYTAVAQSPTVTLPRLKAITTGSNPTFLDAILNIADEGSSSAALEHTDSWVRQLALRSGRPTKLAFAGDDTWLRLFPPRWFSWSEGVSSFFVSDTRTVDSNVTRHLDSLLAERPTASAVPSSDWDVLILHYLGLDHIGHLEGPDSALMRPKQQEMDRVFERFYKSMEERDARDGGKSLLVLIGDHGMTEGGNHGGSAESETSSALLLAAPSLNATLPSWSTGSMQASSYRYHEVVQQVDLVPTLSVLFDLGIPKNSMGRLIPSAVRQLRPSAFASGLSSNVAQITSVLDVAGVRARTILCQAATKLGHSCDGNGQADVETNLMFLQLAQDELLVSFGDYRMNYLFSAVLALAASSIGLLYLSCSVARSTITRSTKVVGLAIIVHLGSFFATSFIEEEHEFFFFVSATAMVLLVFDSKKGSNTRILCLFAAVAVRIMRSWSHNGQKDYPNSTISAYLAHHPLTSSWLVGAAYTTISLIPLANLARVSRHLASEKLTPAQLLPRAIAFAVLATTVSAQALLGLLSKTAADLLSSSSTTARILHELSLGDISTVSRVGYLLGGLGWLLATSLRRRIPPPTRSMLDTTRLAIISIALMSLTRPTNIPLFVLFWIQHLALSRLSTSTSSLLFAFLSIASQLCSFFALGGSNSLATVDLSQAYNGLTSYSFPLVTLLTYLSNFSGPVFFAMSARLLAPAPAAHTTYTTTFFVLALTTLAVSAVHFRYHLFAFTVFSPAVLYKGVWWIAVQVGTNEGLSRLLLL
ncbi:hypothetical protein JCM11491_002242 [Sporobolomyces phaffii]